MLKAFEMQKFEFTQTATAFSVVSGDIYFSYIYIYKLYFNALCTLFTFKVCVLLHIIVTCLLI